MGTALQHKGLEGSDMRNSSMSQPKGVRGTDVR